LATTDDAHDAIAGGFVGAGAAGRPMSCKGDITVCVVPPRQAISSRSTTLAGDVALHAFAGEPLHASAQAKPMSRQVASGRSARHAA
jgi:hypothetical protein